MNVFFQNYTFLYTCILITKLRNWFKSQNCTKHDSIFYHKAISLYSLKSIQSNSSKRINTLCILHKTQIPITLNYSDHYSDTFEDIIELFDTARGSGMIGYLWKRSGTLGYLRSESFLIDGTSFLCCFVGEWCAVVRKLGS